MMDAMQQPKRHEHFFEAAVVAGAFLAVNLVGLAFQHIITQYNGQGGDGVVYYHMARQMQSGQLPFEQGPWTFRIGTPFLASLFPGDLLDSFRLVNIAANALTVVLLAVWLRMNLSSWKVRALMCVLFLIAWHAPARYTYYNPVHVDSWQFVALLAGLILIHHVRQDGLTKQRVLALTALSLVGALFRETVIIIPLALLCVSNPMRDGLRADLKRFNAQPPAQYLPLLGSIIGIGLTHLLAHESGSQHYSFVAAASYWLLNKGPLLYLHAWFLAFGPVLVVLITNLRGLGRFLATHQYQLAYLLVMALLGQIGGTDTERFLFWGMPVVYVLIGKAIESKGRVMASWGLVALMVAGQAVSQRLFWTIPDSIGYRDQPALYPSMMPLLTPWSSHVPFYDLFSYGSSPQVQLVSLAQYLVLTIVLAVWLVYRAARLNAQASAAALRDGRVLQRVLPEA
jgi:hypothetical protein